MAGVSKRLDSHWEQDRLTDGCAFRGEALLLHLCPEGCEVRRDWHAGQNLDIASLEGINLRCEVICQVLVAARIGQLVAKLVENRRETVST